MAETRRGFVSEERAMSTARSEYEGERAAMAALDKRNREWATLLEDSQVLMKRATEEASRKERAAEMLSEKLRVDTERLNEQVCLY